jgi:hypothetical protein
MSGTFNSGGSAFDFNRNVTLSGATIVNSGVGNTIFGGTINGNANLTLTAAATTFGGVIGGTTPIGILTVNGTANVGNNITTNNTAVTFNNAMNLTGDSTIRTNAAITLNSVSSSAGKNLTLNTNTTPVFAGSAGSINSAGGTLTIQPNTNTTTIGMAGGAGAMNLSTALLGKIGSGWSLIQMGSTTGTGAVTVNAYSAWANNILFRSNTGAITLAGAQNFNGFNATIETDSNLAINSTIASSGGILTLRPRSAGTTIGLAGAVGTFNLSVAELNNISDGWSAINIGRSDSTSSITMNAYSNWRDPINFITSGTGAINVTGGAQSSAGGSNASLTFSGPTNISFDINSGTNALTFNNSLAANNTGRTVSAGGNLTLNTVNLGANNFTINTDGDLILNNSITGSGVLTIQGLSAATTMGIGNGSVGTLNLTDTELSRITDGFSQLIFGSATATGAIDVRAATWNDNATFRTLSGAISINGNQTLGSNNIAFIGSGGLNLGADITTFNTAVNFNRAVTLTGNSTINTGTASTTFGNTVNGSFGLTTTASNTVFNNVVGGSTALASLTVNSAASVTGNITTSGNMNFTGALTFLGNSAMNSGSGKISLVGVTGGGNSLTLTSSNLGVDAINFGGAVSGVNVLNVNGLATVANNITTTGNLAFSSALVLSGSSSMNSGASKISLVGVTGGGNNLTLTSTNTSNDAINLAGQISGVNNLSVVGKSTISNDISTTGILSLSDLASMNGNRTISSVGNMTLNAVSLGANNFTINTDGDLVLNNNITGSGALTIQGLSAATTMGIGNGSVGTLNLTDTELSRITNGFSQLTFGSAAATGAIDVRAATWNDDVTFRTLSGTISINGNQTLGANNLAFVGTGGLNLGANITTFNTAVNFNRAVTLTGNSTINTGTAATTFSNTVNGSFGLTTTASNTVFNNAVGASTALASLTVNSAASVTDNIKTTGNMSFANTLILGGNITLDSGTSTMALASVTGAGNNLTLNSTSTSANAINLSGVISGVGILNVNGKSTIANNITTTGNINFAGALTLAGNSTMNAGAGAITYGDTINGAFDLITTANNTIFNGIVGGGTALSSLTVSGPASISSNITTSNGAVSISGLTTLTSSSLISTGSGNITLVGVAAGNNTLAFAGTGGLTMSGNYTSTNTAMNFNRDVILSGATSISTGSGAVNFKKVDGAQNLTVNTIGNITFSDSVGSANRLGTVTITNANNVIATSFKSGSFTQSAGTGATNFSGAGLNTTNNISITSNGITGTYFGIGGQLHSGSGNINATVTFDTLNISGVLANLLAGKIGSSTTVNQNMANLISINGILYPTLLPNSNYKFAGFTIGASIPTTTPTPVVISNTSNVILPDTVQAEGDDLIEEEEQEESQIQQDIQGCGKNFDDSTGCKKLDKSSPIEYHSKN